MLTVALCDVKLQRCHRLTGNLCANWEARPFLWVCTALPQGEWPPLGPSVTAFLQSTATRVPPEKSTAGVISTSQVGKGGYHQAVERVVLGSTAVLGKPRFQQLRTVPGQAQPVLQALLIQVLSQRPASAAEYHSHTGSKMQSRALS